jgi:hypothetical protein
MRANSNRISILMRQVLSQGLLQAIPKKPPVPFLWSRLFTQSSHHNMSAASDGAMPEGESERRAMSKKTREERPYRYVSPEPAGTLEGHVFTEPRADLR